MHKGMRRTLKASDYFDLTSNIHINWLLSSPASLCVGIDSSEIKAASDPAHWH